MITILGGGIAGLTTAYYLSNLTSEKILVIEKEKELGGPCRCINISGKMMPITYHHILKSDKNILKLIKEFGLEKKLFWIHSDMSFYKKGKHNTFRSLSKILKYKGLNFYEKYLLVKFISKAIFGFYDSLENSKAAYIIEKETNKHIYNEIFEPLLRFKFGEAKKLVISKWVTERMKLKEASSKFGFLKGGLGILLNSLETSLFKKKIKILKKHEIKKLKIGYRKHKIYFTGGKSIETDKIVSTLPWPVFSKIEKGFMEDYSKIKYTTAISIILKLDKKINFPYWTNILDDKTHIGGIFNYPSKDSIVYLAKYEFGDCDNLVADKMVKEFLKISGLKLNNIIKKRIYKIPYADPIFDKLYQFKNTGQNMKRGIFFAGINQLPFKTNMDTAVKSAYNIAKCIKLKK